MYKDISIYYEYIFPVKPLKIDFISDISKDKKNVLDIGCSTGELLIKLKEKYPEKEFHGLDLNQNMIEIAKRKTTNIDFKTGDMMEIETIYSKNFDLIISLGNTLVHIKNKHKKIFLEKVYNKLQNNGELVIQILNYDYVYQNKIDELPLIENDKIKFERYYEFENDAIIFKTKLYVKDENKKIENGITLYPIKKNKLEKYLKEVGFKNINFYGNYKKENYSNSLPLILHCKK
ncbi:class I SAM-dependent methyltransferase [Geotoga petraea]|uniref:Class I SAM-dependent methyltransferase n=1 Tax=Geotoga petraea TaxID=28234 RepID=A0A1G6MNN0_9BACT|nr:class I SAM-dependent methyltransferase [Geotoga petraea]TGG87399.1 class I SAM-dependent methyltransferase [Geotoga petraea]SDC57163.1 Methyltransferase domain-containing protein [Geotoga petraea]